MLWKIPVLTINFLFWFYLATFVLSVVYALDQAPVCFSALEGNLLAVLRAVTDLLWFAVGVLLVLVVVVNVYL